MLVAQYLTVPNLKSQRQQQNKMSLMQGLNTLKFKVFPFSFITSFFQWNSFGRITSMNGDICQKKCQKLGISVWKVYVKSSGGWFDFGSVQPCNLFLGPLDLDACFWLSVQWTSGWVVSTTIACPLLRQRPQQKSGRKLGARYWNHGGFLLPHLFCKNGAPSTIFRNSHRRGWPEHSLWLFGFRFWIQTRGGWIVDMNVNRVVVNASWGISFAVTIRTSMAVMVVVVMLLEGHICGCGGGDCRGCRTSGFTIPVSGQATSGSNSAGLAAVSAVSAVRGCQGERGRRPLDKRHGGHSRWQIDLKNVNKQMHYKTRVNFGAKAKLGS